MAYKYSFADNTVYGAEDINSVINRVVTGGVAEVFYDGESYNTSDLNAITGYIATYGVRDAASSTLKVVKLDEGRVKVLSGSAFMNDGACVEVDAEGVELDYTEGQTNYIYIENNLDSTNTIDFVCSLTEGSGDIVPLATISSDGVITDTRVYCRGRLAGYQSTAGLAKIIEVPYSITANNMGVSQTVTVDMGGLGYSRIVNMTSSMLADNDGYRYGVGYYDINTDEYVSVYPGNDDKFMRDTSTMMIYASFTGDYGGDYVQLNFTVNGSELECKFRARHDKGSDKTKYETFEGTAYLFIA